MTDGSEIVEPDLDALLARFLGLRVLVVGDLLWDEYRLGDADRISPEAPVPVVTVREVRAELGGAGNVARGVTALGARCDLVAVVGADAEGAAVRARLEATGIGRVGLVTSPGRPTSHKIRVQAQGQQILRLDREQTDPLAAEEARRVREAVAAALPGADVVVLQDYDKGLFGEGLGSWVIERARALGKPVAADPKHALRRFRGASLLKPNWQEARRFAGDEGERAQSDAASRSSLLEKLQRDLAVEELVVTRGAAGITALGRSGHAIDVPTRPVEVFDVQGAGDTTLAVLALCRAARADLVGACIVANVAAGLAVARRGTTAVTAEALRDAWGRGAGRTRRSN